MKRICKIWLAFNLEFQLLVLSLLIVARPALGGYICYVAITNLVAEWSKQMSVLLISLELIRAALVVFAVDKVLDTLLPMAVGLFFCFIDEVAWRLEKLSMCLKKWKETLNGGESKMAWMNEIPKQGETYEKYVSTVRLCKQDGVEECCLYATEAGLAGLKKDETALDALISQNLDLCKNIVIIKIVPEIMMGKEPEKLAAYFERLEAWTEVHILESRKMQHIMRGVNPPDLHAFSAGF